MKLRLTVSADAGGPDDERCVHLATEAAARVAHTWTEPVFVETIDTEVGSTHVYVTDAVPKRDPNLVTLANIAPTLLPPTTA